MITSYIATLFLIVIILIIVSSFYNIKINKKNSYLNSFIKLTLTISFTISIFAIYICKGKTIFICSIPLLFFLIKTHFIRMNLTPCINFRSFINSILVLIIAIIFQLVLNFDFKLLNPYVVSDDIYLYTTIGNQIVKFGQENTSASLSVFYPDYFTGIQPYHYFEIWLNGLISLFFGNSEIYNFIFITYSLLLWLVLMGFKAILELFNIKKFVFFLIVSFLFIGPVYCNIFYSIFNDGNFFNSAVFTITGFVKQTLPISYFGQKHLPVYIFSIILIIGYLKSNTRLTLIGTILICVSSIGVFPGIILMTSIVLYFNSKKRIKEIYTLFCILSFLLYVYILNFYEIGVSKEIKYKSSYFTYFLQNLNLKGEIIFILEKFTFPLIWFLILYLPIIILIKFCNKQKNEYKKINFYMILTYTGGAIFTETLYGINSDQFVTNLLPLFNIVFITLITKEFIKNYNTFIKWKKIFTFSLFLLIISINFSWTIKFHFIPKLKTHQFQYYSKNTQNLLLSQLNKNCTIAYLLSDSINKNIHPAQYHPFFPAKYIMDKNYFNFVNINYPFIKFKKSTVANAFSSRNQMKYFIKRNSLEKQNFQEVQLFFLKKNNIRWILCTKNTSLPNKINKYVIKTYFDSISKESYYLLNY